MIHITAKIATASARKARGFGAIRNRMAQSLVGRVVSLNVGTETITHGVVTNVLNDTGVPRIVVEGSLFDLDQILTATPASFGF